MHVSARWLAADFKLRHYQTMTLLDRDRVVLVLFSKLAMLRPGRVP
jgi:hypothetical protein